MLVSWNELGSTLSISNFQKSLCRIDDVSSLLIELTSEVIWALSFLCGKVLIQKFNSFNMELISF